MRKVNNILRVSTIIHFVNIIFAFMLYGHLNDHSLMVAPFVGLWGIVLLVYRIFWQFLGFERSYKKRQIDNKRAKEIIEEINRNNQRLDNLTKK